MTENPQVNQSLPITIVTLGVVAVFASVFVFAAAVAPEDIEPTPSTVDPTATVNTSQYQPETIPPSTFTPDPARTSIVPPTYTPTFTLTPTATPTSTPPDRPLPDLIVASISDPVCVKDVYQEVERDYLKVTVLIRNIGLVSTHYYSEVGVYVLVGQRSYSLQNWATEFDGVIGRSSVFVANIDPRKDVTFSLAIDIKDIKNFGIKVVANSGLFPFPEMDVTNNTLIKYFSVYCY